MGACGSKQPVVPAGDAQQTPAPAPAPAAAAAAPAAARAPAPAPAPAPAAAKAQPASSSSGNAAARPSAKNIVQHDSSEEDESANMTVVHRDRKQIDDMTIVCTVYSGPKGELLIKGFSPSLQRDLVLRVSAAEADSLSPTSREEDPAVYFGSLLARLSLRKVGGDLTLSIGAEPDADDAEASRYVVIYRHRLQISGLISIVTVLRSITNQQQLQIKAYNPGSDKEYSRTVTIAELDGLVPANILSSEVDSDLGDAICLTLRLPSDAYGNRTLELVAPGTPEEVSITGGSPAGAIQQSGSVSDAPVVTRACLMGDKALLVSMVFKPSQIEMEALDQVTCTAFRGVLAVAAVREAAGPENAALFTAGEEPKLFKWLSTKLVIVDGALQLQS